MIYKQYMEYSCYLIISTSMILQNAYFWYIFIRLHYSLLDVIRNNDDCHLLSHDIFLPLYCHSMSQEHRIVFGGTWRVLVNDIYQMNFSKVRVLVNSTLKRVGRDVLGVAPNNLYLRMHIPHCNNSIASIWLRNLVNFMLSLRVPVDLQFRDICHNQKFNIETVIWV